MTTVEIAGVTIGDGSPTYVVAEIGVNHQGDVKTALKMIDLAKACGADAVKFQKRTPELSIPEPEWHDIRDTPWGKMSKIDYRRKVEFGLEEYTRIDEHCRKVGLPWFASVWDIPSLIFLAESIQTIHAIKIPSARLHDSKLVVSAARYGRPIILSTGMSSFANVKHAVALVRSSFDGASEGPWMKKPRLIVMQCTSSYPSRADESNLRVIHSYKREFEFPVGFSSHKIGQLTCLLAVAAGANMIERHFTLDRKLRGSDHRLSTEPHELARLVREIREVEKIMGDGMKRVLESEIPEAKRLGGVP